ncbi:MAG TPA: hypothetical protein VGI86_21095 [Acidimicrobiia bacterium]
MEIVLGIAVVGSALVLLGLIVIGPSRRLRSESKMPLETQVRLLLGLPEETGEVRAVRITDDGPTPFDTAQFTALSNLTAHAPESEQSSGAA